MRRQILDKVSKTIMVLVFVYWLIKRFHVMDYLAEYFGGAAATADSTLLTQ